MINDAPVQCGKCIHCKNRRVSGWAARLQKEDMVSTMSFFVTLTYNPESLMFCPKNRPTLYPSHLTQYWKLLRKAKLNFKYYACGEYGSNRQRPHYHAIILIKDDKLTPLQVFKLLENKWQYGDIHVGTVTAQSIAYTLKYISKKPSVPQYRGDTRTPEFQRISKGLGKNYVNKNIISWHLADLEARAYAQINGSKYALPRYWKDRIYTKEQKAKIGEYLQKESVALNYDELKEARKRSNRKLNS